MDHGNIKLHDILKLGSIDGFEIYQGSTHWSREY